MHFTQEEYKQRLINLNKIIKERLSNKILKEKMKNESENRRKNAIKSQNL